jgi:hypothetical protein
MPEVLPMSRFAVFIVLGLASCSLFDFGEQAAPGSGEMQGWRLASGKPPTRAEYAAVVAACRDGAVKRAEARPLDACLADLGLKRAP